MTAYPLQTGNRPRGMTVVKVSLAFAVLAVLPWRLGASGLYLVMGIPVSPLSGLWIPAHLGIEPNWVWFALDWIACATVLMVFIAARGLMAHQAIWARTALVAAAAMTGYSNVAVIWMFTSTEFSSLVIVIAEAASFTAALVAIGTMGMSRLCVRRPDAAVEPESNRMFMQ